MFSRSSEYSAVTRRSEELDDTEKLLSHNTSSNSYRSGSEKLSATKLVLNSYWAYLTHGILLLFCFVFLFLWSRARRQASITTLPYSPSNAGLEFEKEHTIFKGSFRAPSIYRGQPTPELDEAWFNISSGATMSRLTREELIKIGKEDTPSIVKYSEADGGGYMGALAVTHQLHCLNVLRKYLYFDHYSTFDPFFTEAKEETYRAHLEHCIEILRQVLMCNPDTTMITFDWVRGFSTPYPDFNTEHQCMNYDKLLAWQDANGIPDSIRASHIVRLEGEVDLIIPP
ncbi:hypothetical protein HYPSUDRAFT_45945 [Hypholoma sublateritium FD-334 SS-4]|uniref:Tat pathway signal sequence n=1 Tax=Hypholoma sublateritium (strain FD-334 SS-4) TaxID=945553 RepID=A0A0D2KT06_HYPSF|nr:hypothetical protein HYPSUDRAFT_45945 [Hypholoma sublateritium FD-334 SS-4]